MSEVSGTFVGKIPVQHLPLDVQPDFGNYSHGNLEKNFQEMYGPGLVKRHRILDEEGRVDILATAGSVGAVVQSRDLRPIGRIGVTAPVKNEGYVITVDDGLTPADWAFTVGHEVGHIMLFAWARHRGKQLDRPDYLGFFMKHVRTNDEYYQRTEALCDYISCKILGYIE